MNDSFKAFKTFQYCDSMESVGKKYQVIYADPPWAYRVGSKKEKGRTAASHYQTQPIGRLKAFNIPDICDQNFVLLMWATYPCLKSALELVEAWGLIIKLWLLPG